MNGKTNNISSLQLILLLVGSRIMIAYTNLPALLEPPENQDVWIAFLLSSIYTILFCFPIIYISNKFKGISFSKKCEMIIGKIPSKIFICLYALFFSYYVLRAILQETIFINSSVFPETPVWGLLLYILIPVAFATLKGAGAIGRIGYFIVPYVIVTIVAFFILSLNKMDIDVLFPVLKSSSFMELNKGAFSSGILFSDVFLIPILSVYLPKNISIYKTFFKSVAMYIVLGIIIIIPTITVLGLDVAQRAWNPYYMFTRQVETYDFIQRVESLNILGWFMAMLLRITIYCYMASKILSDTFKTKSHKPFVLPILLVTGIIGLFPAINNTFIMNKLIHFKLDRYAFVFILPAIEMIIYFIRKKKLDPKIKELQKTPPEDEPEQKYKAS